MSVTITTDRPLDRTTSGEPDRPGNATAKHDNVALLSVATTIADRVTTSACIAAFTIAMVGVAYLSMRRHCHAPLMP